MALRRSAGQLARRLSQAVAAETETSTSQISQASRAWRQPAGHGARSYASQGAPQSRGPVSYLSLGLTLGSGVGLLWWYQHEKEQKLKSISGDRSVVVGQASIGGPFQLTDHRGRPFSDADLRGTFSLLYFGFCYCPDVCPEELEKVAAAVNAVEKDTRVQIVPVFITVDPERDGVKQVAEYVAEFHPRMVGLTGSVDKVKEAAKAYRVYFNKTGDSDDDYLVDHSIITYLVDPEGKFVTFYGKNYTAEQMAKNIAEHVRSWQGKHPGWPEK